MHASGDVFYYFSPERTTKREQRALGYCCKCGFRLDSFVITTFQGGPPSTEQSGQCAATDASAAQKGPIPVKCSVQYGTTCDDKRHEKFEHKVTRWLVMWWGRGGRVVWVWAMRVWWW